MLFAANSFQRWLAATNLITRIFLIVFALTCPQNPIERVKFVSTVQRFEFCSNYPFKNCDCGAKYANSLLSTSPRNTNLLLFLRLCDGKRLFSKTFFRKTLQIPYNKIKETIFKLLFKRSSPAVNHISQFYCVYFLPEYYQNIGKNGNIMVKTIN